MTARCISPDYQINGVEYELWIDGDQWWLNFGGVEQDQDQFDTKTVEKICEYIYDYRTS